MGVGSGRGLGKSKRIRVGRHLSLEKQRSGWRLPSRVRLWGAPTASGRAPTPRPLLPVSLARHPALLMKINEAADGWLALSAAALVGSCAHGTRAEGTWPRLFVMAWAHVRDAAAARCLVGKKGT